MKTLPAAVLLSTVLMQSGAFAADATMPSQEKMQEMQTMMAAIKAEQDPAKRQVLMTQHMDLMHQNMQMMAHGDSGDTAAMPMEGRMGTMEQKMNMMQMMMEQMMQHDGEENAQPVHEHE